MAAGLSQRQINDRVRRGSIRCQRELAAVGIPAVREKFGVLSYRGPKGDLFAGWSVNRASNGEVFGWPVMVIAPRGSAAHLSFNKPGEWRIGMDVAASMLGDVVPVEAGLI